MSLTKLRPPFDGWYPRRALVQTQLIQGGGIGVIAQTDLHTVQLTPSPRPGRYETVISIYRILPEPPYEAGPVPGSLW